MQPTKYRFYYSIMKADSPPTEFEELRKLIATPELPELGPGPRSPVLALPALTHALDGCLSRSSVPASAHRPIRATILLWHDHLDAAHQIAQDLPGPEGSLLHGIMHRREPDYGNAKYWFHRVGRHPCFLALARKAGALLESKNEKILLHELISSGDWDPSGFIDACERAAARPSSDPQSHLLRAIQGIELELLLERFWGVAE